MDTVMSASHLSSHLAGKVGTIQTCNLLRYYNYSPKCGFRANEDSAVCFCGYQRLHWLESKESVRAKLRVIVKRTVRHFGYPPDMQQLATETVLRQAELIGAELSVN